MVLVAAALMAVNAHAQQQPAAPPLQLVPEQREAAEKLGVPAAIKNSIAMQLVLIPPGEFLMGSPEAANVSTFDDRSYEKPQHRVRITQPFFLVIHEVTREQYEQVMGRHPSFFSRGDSRNNAASGQDTNSLPMERVNWGDVVLFCAKLSELPEEKAAGRVYRLPTEAEWEYACRAGTRTQCYSGDDESGLGDYAWYRENSGTRPHPVGGKRPNAWGLYDMHGNVWEWCADWHDDFEQGKSPVNDPTGPTSGSHRVLRGGCWHNSATSCRSANRGRGDVTSSDTVGLGVRVAVSPLGHERSR